MWYTLSTCIKSTYPQVAMIHTQGRSRMNEWSCTESSCVGVSWPHAASLKDHHTPWHEVLHCLWQHYFNIARRRKPYPWFRHAEFWGGCACKVAKLLRAPFATGLQRLYRPRAPEVSNPDKGQEASNLATCNSSYAITYYRVPWCTKIYSKNNNILLFTCTHYYISKHTDIYYWVLDTILMFTHQ